MDITRFQFIYSDNIVRPATFFKRAVDVITANINISTQDKNNKGSVTIWIAL